MWLWCRRGLSKFYQGKSQSFTSLTKVRSLEDLAKPENPYNKRLKSCKSYGGGLAESQGVPRAVSKRGMVHSASSRGSCSSLNARKGSATNFIGTRPPIPPHRSTSTNTNIPSQTVLFAWKGIVWKFLLLNWVFVLTFGGIMRVDSVVSFEETVGERESATTNLNFILFFHMLNFGLEILCRWFFLCQRLK